MTAVAALDNARAVVEGEARELDRLDQRIAAQVGDRSWRAMMLTPSVEVAAALLRGEAVPLDRLDPVWVRRFGRRAA